MAKYDDTATNRFRGKLAATAIRLIGALPLPLNRALGVLAGWLAWRIGAKSRHITDVNLTLCFPELDAQARRRLTRQSMIETGKGAAETALLWRHPDRGVAKVVSVEGVDPLRDTLGQGQPVVVLAPHLGCWEVVNFWLSSQFDLHALFKPSHFQAVNDLVLASREHFGGTFYPASARGVASLIRAMRGKPVITGILPDQVPDQRGGQFVPFFGQLTLTGTLPVKLLQQSGARAFVIFAKRLPGTQGYHIIIREAENDIHDTDLGIALAAMNRSVENLIREAPAQYVWNYKRFRRTSDGSPSPY
jgi:Kdo2-lipid IVA lauroyltransferase/acyltransferase